MDSRITQPLTDADVSSVTQAFASSGDGGAKLAAQKMIFSIAASASTMNLSSADVFAALAAGADNFADRSLYEALAMECSLPSGSWGALVIQGAGVMQMITWAKAAPAWIAAQLSTLETVLTNAVSGNLKGAATSFMSMFGIGTPVSKDAAALTNMFALMASSQAPALGTMITALSSKTAINPGAPTSGGNPKKKGSSASSSNSGSSSASQSSSASAQPKDMASVGIRSRRSLNRINR
jgi:hypothetical protein